MKSSNLTRLSKYLADCGIGSRRKCEELIAGGRIKVNGCTVKNLSLKVDQGDKVAYKNRLITPPDKIVIALNKPRGILSTVSDEHRRKTVTDLIDIRNLRLYPAGRLDKDSRGLIILTNDGSLVYIITHPKHNITKTYEVTLDKAPDDTVIERLKKGVLIDKRLFRPEKVKAIKKGRRTSRLLLEIHEGRKRIIRRVFDKLGYRVEDLKRVKIGRLSLSGLHEGSYRILNEYEIGRLMEEKIRHKSDRYKR